MQESHLISSLMNLAIFQAEWALWALTFLSISSVAVMVELSIFYRRRAFNLNGVRRRFSDLLSRGDRKGAAWGGLLACTLSVGCGDKSDPSGVDEPDDGSVDCSEIPAERLPKTSESFSQTECNKSVAGHITQFGYVSVPLYPGSSESIDIAVARVFSTEPNPQGDPIVYLEGGPGGESLSGLEELHPDMEPISPDRDFIFIDQRGVGRSRPNLECTETQQDFYEALDACYERLSKEVDLDQINTVNNAHDIDQVRQALGYDRWNLLGVSYGTRLGLTVMRDYPQGVRAALLDSVVPLHRDILGEVGFNAYSAILKTLNACEENGQCAQKYPDLLDKLTEVVVRLNQEPVKVGGVPFEGDLLLGLVSNLLYSPISIGMVPLLIENVHNGDFDLLKELLQRDGPSGGGFSLGMLLSLDCSEEVAFSSREAFELLDKQVPQVFRAGLSAARLLDDCEHWPVAAAPATENEPVVSDLPTLLMAGEFDPITPPIFAEAAFEHLTNAQYILVENESHGVSFGECGVKIAREFFANPEGPLDSSCLNQVPGIEFLSTNAPWTRSRVSSDEIDFAMETPSPEDVARALDDLKRRLR